MTIDLQKLEETAASYSQEEECDILLFTGGLDPTAYNRLNQSCRHRNRRKRILLTLVTWGGDAHIAYKMGRCLQRQYEEVRVFVPGQCKSAGTLLSISGHRLIISDDGELGPIDVQRMRQDDLWETASGLIESAAMESLGQISRELFGMLIAEIKGMSLGQITFKTAADAAAPIVSGMLSPIFAQIDPLKVGEAARALQIASKYAELLNKTSQNLRIEDMAIDKLATGYPDHGFVIDREEAETLFKNVEEPNDLLQTLSGNLGSLDPNRAIITFLNDKLPTGTSTKEREDETTNEGSGTEEDGNNTTPADGDMAYAKEDQTNDREDGSGSKET